MDVWGMTERKQQEQESAQRLWDAYNELLLSPDLDRVRKMLVRYDLFRRTLDVPGDIVECGVFKGVSLMYWLKLLQIYAPTSRKRVVGFDTFMPFAGEMRDYEVQNAQALLDEANFKGTTPERIARYAREIGLEDKVELVAGDIADTANEYVKDNGGFRISLLHLDVDTYAATTAALSAFYDCITPGGLVICDEYAYRGWGESDAVDEFLSGRSVPVKVVPFADTPTAYFVKPIA
jgi:hypothetical protein